MALFKLATKLAPQAIRLIKGGAKGKPNRYLQSSGRSSADIKGWNENLWWLKQNGQNCLQC